MSVALAPDTAPAPKRRVKRLRLAAIVFATLLLGSVSFAFGLFVSFASQLPNLTGFAEYKNERSSILLDDLGHPIGILSQQNRVIVTPAQIPTVVKDAVISIEDKRFYSNSGVDLRSVARAFVQDVFHTGGTGTQGASTIEQQFIKNALQAQSHRTILEKFREMGLAFRLAHEWSKEKILAAYLNTIYFGNGAYGIEAAAETYFGHDVNHLGCGPPPAHELCLAHLAPWEAALLAGIIQSPTAYDPTVHPRAAEVRRNLVLEQMLQQGYLTRPVYEQSIHEALPSARSVQPPKAQTVEGVDAGYFTSWVDQQVIERYRSRALLGGLRIKTTLDLELQKAAEQAVESYLPYSGGPGAAMVVIENATGDVRAMVGGRNYETTPFNLATEGERQPGSSFKAFDLAAALEDGISPESVWPSQQKTFYYHGPNGVEKFVVHNDEGAYSGSNTLTGATAFSDNSIYAEVGLKVGTRRIAALARAMGITTPLSTNAAMTIGGLTIGVTPLDMAHAYETLAHGGQRIGGSLAEPGQPVGIQEVTSSGAALPDGSHAESNHVLAHRVLPASIASTETSMLEAVVQYGTGRAAAIGQFAAGKTGTTTNYGDAWFVGWNSKYTVAVWVGYPDKLVPMTTDFNGQPVLGGTFPALIWHQFMLAALGIEKSRAEHAAAGHGEKGAAPGATTGAGEGSAATGTTAGGAATTPAPTHTAPTGGQSEHTAAPAEHAAPTTTPATPSPPTPTPATPPAATPPAATPTPSQPSGGASSPTGGAAPSG